MTHEKHLFVMELELEIEVVVEVAIWVDVGNTYPLEWLGVNLAE